MNNSPNSLTISVADGSFQCYVARPSATLDSAPVIIVIQEIFGVNAGLRSIADDYAAKGYIALAPDLFWRAAPGLALSEASPADWAQGFALYSAYDIERGVQDLAATIAAARQLAGASGKVGVTGYCLGGLMTFLCAAATDADASVAYYGGSTEKYLERAASISRPLLMHLAGADEYIDTEAQAAIHATLDGHPQASVHDYAGCHHAFARPGGSHYDADAAALANCRTDTFFSRHLR